MVAVIVARVMTRADIKVNTSFIVGYYSGCYGDHFTLKSIIILGVVIQVNANVVTIVVAMVITSP